MSAVPPEKKLTQIQINALSVRYQVEVAAIKAFAEVEGSGIGFSDVTGRMLIQFEPAWMKRFLRDKHTPMKMDYWINNGVGNQTVEYAAFQNASSIDTDSAMKATSIGMMQVMGFHYKTLGFTTVTEFWKFGMVSESNQLELGLMFIRANASLYNALKRKNWHLVAYYYNGSGYKELAARMHSMPYDIRFANAYQKFISTETITRTTTTVNIRQGPSAMADLVSTPLRVNTIVNVISEDNGWKYVKVPITGIVGWVSGQYIK